MRAGGAQPLCRPPPPDSNAYTEAGSRWSQHSISLIFFSSPCGARFFRRRFCAGPEEFMNLLGPLVPSSKWFGISSVQFPFNNLSGKFVQFSS